ncbi:SWIM zinc finger family protein [Kribbella deserti]|uniref:SWIM zinc finger family protein n=1 Tax=Kribbella deserti TaxID=1926257 RepID=A0ABV6QLK8_9ACTN
MNGEQARGFPAFPAQRGRSTRGQSWWGRAWVQALEDTSLDADQLRKGRRYANSGQVGTITISPGRIAATVHGPHDSYDAVVLVDRLSDADWDRFLEQIAARSGFLAALLDGEMPHALVEAAGDAGVPLLPGIGDLDPSCSCESWELPCQHAAALCYQTAWLLDEDPFILLLLRGQDRDTLLERLHAATPVPAAPPAETSTQPGVPSEGLPDVPAAPGPLAIDDLPVTGIEPPDGLDPSTLPLLVIDAVGRARRMFAGLVAGEMPPAELNDWQDAVRLAANYPPLEARLASATGRAAELPTAVRAWSYGGAEGLDVLENSWAPTTGEAARARAELVAAWDDESLEVELMDNRLTLTTGSETRQLRLDRLGRWHPYELLDQVWAPAGSPDRDPVGVIAALEG